MATTPQAVERFEQKQIFPAPVVLTVRRLRESTPELLPAFGRGGGKAMGHAEPRHLTNLLLAQAAHLPIDAAAAVKALRNLRQTKCEIFGGHPHAERLDLGPNMQMPVLGAELDAMIDAAGHPMHRAAWIEKYSGLQARTPHYEWTLTLCADGPFAAVTTRGSRTLLVRTFGASPTPSQAHRLITLPFRAILIAGELWEDTLAHRTASSKTESAETPGRASAPDRRPAQGRTVPSTY